MLSIIADWRPVLLSHLQERLADCAFGLPQDVHMRLAAGEVGAIPVDLRWEQSATIAHAINDCDLAPLLGIDHVGDLANQRSFEPESDLYRGNLAELWLCLFFEHRRYRHFGYPPEGDMLCKLEKLCTAFAAEAAQECDLRQASGF